MFAEMRDELKLQLWLVAQNSRTLNYITQDEMIFVHLKQSRNVFHDAIHESFNNLTNFITYM